MSLIKGNLEVKNHCKRIEVINDFKDIEDIERSIITKYRKTLWSKFIKGIKEYEMIEDGDKIAVCISGGKDSLLLAKLMQELQKHSKQNFELKFIAMDPGFNEVNYTILKNSCEKLNIDVNIFNTNIFNTINKIAQDYPCYLCAKMRRGALYNYAKSQGCNKIALGHHYDDFIETVLINVLYGGKFNAMMPKLKATNPKYKGIELIRPMVYVRENDIISYTKYNGIQTMNCGCVVTASKISSKRLEIKELLGELRKTNKNIDKSIFAATKNVQISSLIGWKDNEKKYSFLDKYKEE